MAEVFRVSKIVRNSKTHVELEGGHQLKLRPFVYLSEGDELKVERKNGRLRVDKVLPGGSVSVHPGFSWSTFVQVGSCKLRIRIRERASLEDWRRARALERYHYRGAQVKFIPGRKTTLIAEVTDGPANLIGEVVGYVVLASPLPAVSVRLRLLKQSFGEHLRSGTINRFVRIPRVVVAPEMRGLGIGKALAEAGTKYARTRWELGGVRPWALEVVAAMTDYHPFFESIGFVRVGRTGPKPEPIKPAYGSTNGWKPRPEAQNYAFRTFKQSKPYLLYPLDAEFGKTIPGASSSPKDEAIATSRPRLLTAQNLRCSVDLRVRQSYRSRKVAEAFGLSDEETHRRVEILRLRYAAFLSGDVVLIGGPSGSGKTMLARALTGIRPPRGVFVEGRLGRPSNLRVVELDDKPFPAKPLIDLVPLPLEEAIELLNLVGLSEPRLFSMSPRGLSVGQQHRLRLALLAASKAHCWVADDLGAGLDDFSAAVAAKGLARMARRQGALLVATTSTPGRMVDALQPDVFLDVSLGGRVVTRGHKRTRER